ncbi:MAG: fatty acid desaturase [Acidobacteriota bacterium]
MHSSISIPHLRASPLDEAIHAIPIEWFKPAPAVYWLDLSTSAAIGWTTLALAVSASGWRRGMLLLMAVAGLYRAVLFIHEITHRAGRDVPAFTLVWNTLVGVPLLIPSFLYEGVHTDHHRASCYGTDADPEYVPFSRRPPAVLIGSSLASLLAPGALALRFGVLAPLSWAIPALRRPILERCSALCINPNYVRRVPLTSAARLQEIAAFAAFWTAVALSSTGQLPAAALFCWFVVTAAVSALNAVRTLAAHRYDLDAGDLSMTAQLLDSCTIAGGRRLRTRIADAARVLGAPVGLRYHALHHWIPSLPYHNLGRVHRLLVSSLRADAPYRATIEPGFTPPLRDLVRRSRAHPR